MCSGPPIRSSRLHFVIYALITGPFNFSNHDLSLVAGANNLRHVLELHNVFLPCCFRCIACVVVIGSVPTSIDRHDVEAHDCYQDRLTLYLGQFVGSFTNSGSLTVQGRC